MTQGENSRRLAFRTLARARAISNAGEPNAAGVYNQAQQLAEQAIENSQNEVEAQLARQLMHIVVTDQHRHSLANSTY